MNELKRKVIDELIVSHIFELVPSRKEYEAVIKEPISAAEMIKITCDYDMKHHWMGGLIPGWIEEGYISYEDIAKGITPQYAEAESIDGWCGIFEWLYVNDKKSADLFLIRMLQHFIKMENTEAFSVLIVMLPNIICLEDEQVIALSRIANKYVDFLDEAEQAILKEYKIPYKTTT